MPDLEQHTQEILSMARQVAEHFGEDINYAGSGWVGKEYLFRQGDLMITDVDLEALDGPSGRFGTNVYYRDEIVCSEHQSSVHEEKWLGALEVLYRRSKDQP